MPGFRSSRGRSIGLRGGRQSRRLEWVGSGSAAIVTTSAGTKSAVYVLNPSTVRDDYSDPTLTRFLGQLTITQATAVFTAGAVGLITWPDIDDTAPASAEMPGPFLQPGMDWVWHSYFFSTGQGLLTLHFSDGHSGQKIESRAQRKLGSRKGLLFVLENSSTSLGAVSWLMGGRCLLKE